MRAYDYVIVGSGPAGCCLAARLTEDPDVSVLLLEAGGADRHPYIRVPAGFAKLTGTSHTWGYSTAPQQAIDGRAMWYPQGRVLGGGSSINAMVYARGNAKDYDAWADAGCTGWSYADVLPYFKRPEDNERFHNDYHALRRSPWSQRPCPSLADIGRIPARGAAGGAALQPGLQRRGAGWLRLLPGDQPQRPALQRRRCLPAACDGASEPHGGDPCDGRACGCRGGTRDRRRLRPPLGRRRHARATREVLVCAGAIGSPRLLMLSGIGRGDELKALGIDVVSTTCPASGRTCRTTWTFMW